MDELTSIDYANLLNWVAYNKHNVLLNKTQINKLLFMCYGIYLASTGNKLFKDDSPKAWPYGPVFPNVYRKFIPNYIPKDFDESKKEVFRKDATAMSVVIKVMKKFHSYSAYSLSEWSHKEGGPWYKTVYGSDDQSPKWNATIEDEFIKEYFTPSKR